MIRVAGSRNCLDLVSLGPAMFFSGAMPDDCFTIIFVLTCPKKGRSFNFGIEHTDGYIGFFPPRGILDAATPAGYKNASLTIPVADFHVALSVHFPEIPQKILEKGAGLRVGPAECAVLRGLLNALEGAIADPAQPMLNEVGRQYVESQLLGAFLAALRSGCEQIVPLPPPRLAGRLRRFREAREYLNEHLHEPLYTESLSEATGLTPRAVEHLFRDYLHTSPMVFVRHQRLHRVRRILEASVPFPGLVKATALEWGFWHLGHFAREYRVLFGENPQETLAREPRGSYH